MIKPGDVLLVSFPASGRAKRKLRPALYLAELPGEFQKFLLCGISTRLDNVASDWDELMDSRATDYRSTGLHRPSTIRLSYLFAANPSEVSGKIGRVTEERLNRLRNRLVEHLRP